ncbi:hypothetical protein F4806DRAFT_495093 [Annulohypoxylon nitens]|nr:hypothetical protein F4806DRAFT_495093 [Annulohypoxylon nitens]
MSQRTRTDYEAEVRSWGFPHVFTWTDGPARSGTRSALPKAMRAKPDKTGQYFFANPCPCDSNAHYQPHSHAGLTTHLITAGQLTITYPKDPKPEKKTYTVGDRIDVDAGRVHEVWIGNEGCTYVIGE